MIIIAIIIISNENGVEGGGTKWRGLIISVNDIWMAY